MKQIIGEFAYVAKLQQFACLRQNVAFFACIEKQIGLANSCLKPRSRNVVASARRCLMATSYTLTATRLPV